MRSRPKTRFTLAEYLALSAASEEKLEFVNGEILQMAGGSNAHNRISANIVRSLGNRLAGGPCAATTSDQRVQIVETGMWDYPDVTVVRGPPVFSPFDAQTVVNPSAVVEVLSPSTAAYDRSAKLAHYLKLPSLRHFLVVSQGERQVEHFRRTGTDQWDSAVAVEGDTLDLAGLGIVLPLAEIYERVELEHGPGVVR